MNEELRAAGLTDGEITVYTTLLKLGESTHGPIAKHTHQQSSTVYYCLNSLIEKGFVQYIRRSQRKIYTAADPKVIRERMKERLNTLQNEITQFEKVLPTLQAQQHLLRDKTAVEVYEGWNGFRAIFSEILLELKRGDSYEAFVLEQSVGEFERLSTFFIEYNKELHRRGITLRLVATERTRPVFEKIYGKSFLGKYQIIHYSKMRTPTAVTIYKDTVVTHVNEGDQLISIKVKNSALARSYRQFFDDVWKDAKP